VRFVLTHGGSRILDLPVAASLAERAGRVLGTRTAGQLLPFSLERGGIRVHGLAGRPADAGSRRDGQHLFVNGRVVQDRVLAHAITEAYGNTVPRDRHPSLIVLVEIDARRVDVNVHPQKLEVRFSGSQEVHDLVREAVAQAFRGSRASPELSDLRPGAGPRREPLPAALPYRSRSIAETPSPLTAAGEGAEVEAAAPAATGGSEPGRTRPPVPLAQFWNSYILAEDGDAIVVVDQHAAHERILFERYLAAAEENRVDVQTLLFPRTVELAPHERALVQEELEEFRRQCTIPLAGKR